MNDVLTGTLTLIALIDLALFLDRQRWREIAQNRHRFILDLQAAARVPPNWALGPSYIRHLVEAKLRAELQAACKSSCLDAMEQERNRQITRADAATGQARRWANIAQQQRETFRELSALLENDTERILDRGATEIVNVLRRIGIGLGLCNWATAACWCFEAAALIDARLLKDGCRNGTDGKRDHHPIDTIDHQDPRIKVP